MKFKRTRQIGRVKDISDDACLILEEKGTLKKIPVSELPDDLDLEGGASHWDDLEGKPFGTETIRTTYLEEQEIALNDTGDATVQLLNPIPWDEDVEIIVMADGARNENNCKYGYLDIQRASASYYDVTLNRGFDGDKSVLTIRASDYDNDGLPKTVTLEIYSEETETVQLPAEYLPEHTHKWEDVENPPFGEEEKKDYIIEDLTITVEPHSEYSIAHVTNVEATINVGESYYFVHNGVVTEFIGKTGFDASTQTDKVYIGDLAPDDVAASSATSSDRFGLIGNPYSDTCNLYIGPAVKIGDVISVYQLEESVNPLSEKYIPTTIPRTPTAAVGQVVRVKAVDSNGVPTEWEAADMGGGVEPIFLVLETDNYTVSCDVSEDEVVNSALNMSRPIYLKKINAANTTNKLYGLTSYEIDSYGQINFKFADNLINQNKGEGFVLNP